MNSKLSIILIGDVNVGKTHMLNTFTQRNKEINTTIGIDFVNRTFLLGDHAVSVNIWDTAGQERFRSITQSYYHHIDGVMLVFDLTCRQSFLNLDFWFHDIQTKSSCHIPLIIVGHKNDLPGRQVTSSEATLFANKYNCHYFETSINDFNSLEIAFFDILTQSFFSSLPSSPDLQPTTPFSLCSC